MTRTSRKNGRHFEGGIALLVALFTLLLLTAIGAGLILLTTTDVNVSSNFRDEQTAFFAAKAGMEEVRDRFRSTASNTFNPAGSATLLPTVVMGQTKGVLYVTNPLNGETDTPWALPGTAGTAYPDDEICSEMTTMGAACAGNPVAVPAGSPWYTTQSASTSYAPTSGSVLPWKWVRVNLKTNLTSSGTSSSSAVDGITAHTNWPVCWGGTTEEAYDPTLYASCSAAYGPMAEPVYVMTALAVTPSGSRRMVQAEASATTFPSLPGAMTLDGSGPTYSAPSSNAFTVTGNDQSGPQSSNPNAPPGCPSGQPAQYALGGFDANSVSGKNGLDSDVSKRPASYTGAGGTPSIGNVGPPPGSNALGNLATVGGLEALVNAVTNAASPANVYGSNPSGGITNPGTVGCSTCSPVVPFSPVINVVQGDITLAGGWSGAGILLVEGTLTLKGNPGYDGLILVIGKGDIEKSGGGNGTVDGAILVANLYNSASPPVLLPGSSAPGTPTINWNGGGNATIQYDSCWSTAMSGSLAYKVVAVRELMR